MLTGADGLAWGTDAIFAFLLEELFDQPIFKRMKTDDGYLSARSQATCQHR